MVRDTVTCTDDLNERETELFERELIRYKQMNFQASDDVKKLILRDLSYKQMHLVNSDLLEVLDTGKSELDENKIYVFAQFFKPGKSNYVTCLVDESNDLQFFAHKMVTAKREE